MRASFFIGSVTLAAAAAVACAATGDEEGPPPSEPDSGTTAPPVIEAGTTELDASNEAAPPVGDLRCSAAGWCVTDLPDADLLMKDIWLVPGRAFVVAESSSLGVRVLEWVEADAKWTYIDDGTQNEAGRGLWAGKIWAPDANDVYFGVSPGWIFHGTRTAPGAAWSWAHDRLGTSNGADPNDGNPNNWKRGLATPALGVWGTSRDDVYAWFKGTIHHWTSIDGGAPEWVPEYVAADTEAANEQLNFFAAAGKSGSDIWFAGARSRVFSGCALLVRKTTAGGWERIADGIAGGFNQACKPRPGALLIGGSEGMLTDLEALSANEIVGLKGARDAVKISIQADSYSIEIASVPPVISASALNSLSTLAGDLWLGGNGVVLQGSGAWDGGAFQVSTIALNGAPLKSPIYQVRGTSNTNLWAIGARYALHKTTP